MTAMPPLRDILNNTPANAVDVDYNFKTIQSHIATELVNRDGSVSITGPINVPPPTAPSNAANKAYVDAVIPVGMIAPYAGQIAPAGWAMCDAAVKSTTDPAYAALFGVIGNFYNRGDEGPGNFRLPDLLGRVPVGRWSGNGVIDTIGKKIGSYDSALPSHQHTINHGHTAGSSGAGAHTHTVSRQSGAGTASPLALTVNVGAGTETTSLAPDHSHPITVDPLTGVSGFQGVSPTNANMQPCTVINYIIRIGVV